MRRIWNDGIRFILAHYQLSKRTDTKFWLDSKNVEMKKNIWDYYNSKNTFYIQVGGFGLYHMGNNPANLPIPPLNVNAKLRIRTKTGKSFPFYSYRFTTALLVQGKPMKSTMDLDRRADLDKLAA